MISSHTHQRLQRDLELEETKLRNLLRTIYLEEGRAWDIWAYEVRTNGLEKTLKRILDRPKTFGGLRGHIRLGFLKDKDVGERERALKSFAFQAERWRTSQLHVEQTNARLKEMAAQQANTPKTESPTRLNEPQVDASRQR
jgi:hypothetical protein